MESVKIEVKSNKGITGSRGSSRSGKAACLMPLSLIYSPQWHSILLNTFRNALPFDSNETVNRYNLLR